MVPVNFSIERQYVTDFVKMLDKLYDRKKRFVLLDFSNTEKVTKGAMLVLCAQVEKIRTERTFYFKFIGIPDRLKKNLSGDYTRLTNKDDIDYDKICAGTDNFHKLDPNIIDNITKDLRKIGITGNTPKVMMYRERVEALFTEAMGNAIEHGLLSRRKINCWLTSEINYNSKTVEFTFVDMGLGIAKSYRNTSLPFIDRIKSDKKIVLRSLAGKMGSSTKDPDRGRGLPEISDIVKGGYIQNFELITNKVAVDYNDSAFHGQKIPNFAGTCYSWTITKNNFSTWKILK